MAARGSSGLTEDEVAGLRRDVAAGRRPRVVLSGPQFPPGTTGSVLRVGEPADGAEFILVRASVQGVTDELTFAPGELNLPGRARVAARPRRAKPEVPRTETAPPAPKPPPAPATRKPAKRPGNLPAISITLTSAGTTWSVSAQRGNKALLRNAAVPPGVVTAVAALLSQPAIDEAVAAVNETARAEAQSRAEALRAELAEVEAALDSYRAPGGRAR
jgi:hypothetical protein